MRERILCAGAEVIFFENKDQMVSREKRTLAGGSDFFGHLNGIL
jgi:hypothetical protein